MSRGTTPSFDATAPLRSGTVLLEASAGTGKTHTITSLVLRLVAEDGIDLDRILIVTFTRAAAAELRGRVRSRLTAAAAALDDAIARGWSRAELERHSGDEVVIHLIAGALEHGDGELQRRSRRLRTAAQHFDDATIDTIHGFCQRTLQRAAPDVDLEVGAQLTEDVGDLIDELVQDALVHELRRADPDWFRFVSGAGFDARRLRTIALKLESEPDLRVLPDRAELPAGSPQEHWDTAVQRFRSAWAAQGQQLAAWLIAHAADGFRGSYYNRKRPLSEAGKLSAWCRDGPLPIGDLAGMRACLRYVSRSEMEARLEDPAALPDHLDVIDAADALLDAPHVLAAGVLLRFVDHVGTELPRRKAAHGVLSFTDLLVALDRALAADATRSAVRDGIRARFDAALIDEFQDTDPVQWRIFDRVFGSDSRLQLIGDPKQAIYGFRGADVHTYLTAKAQIPAASRFTLPTNHRSDSRYLAALEELFGRDFGPDGPFAVADIDYVPVRAAAGNSQDRLRFADGPRPALELRYVSRALHADAGQEPDPTAVLPVAWARPFLARTVAQEIVELLEDDATIRSGDGWRGLVPRDIAVLVRTNEQASLVQGALLERGVPAVVAADDSVFSTTDAAALQHLFEALLRPSSDRAVRAVLAGPVIGRTATELARYDGDDGSIEQLGAWAAIWRGRGTTALLREVFADARTASRLLTQPRGERTLTNFAHLAELLHDAETAGRLGPEGVTSWLREQRQLDLPGDDDRQLRLESDDDAVTVVTVHRAKGLQYPVVWCPFLWDGKLLFQEDRAVLRFLDPHTNRLSLDLDTDVDGDAKRRHLAYARRERWEEQLRLLYVALTRAQHRCVIHTGPFAGVGVSPLQRLLHGAGFGEADGLPTPPDDPKGVGDDELLRALGKLASDHVGVREVQQASSEVAWLPAYGDPVPLRARSLERVLDRSWQRTSFSRLTSGDVPRQATPGAGLTPHDDPRRDDGRDHDHDVDPANNSVPVVGSGGEWPDAAEVTLAHFPRGAAPGTFLHELLEHLDFRDAADPAVLRGLIATLAPRANLGRLDAGGIDALVAGVQELLATPLGVSLGDVALRDLSRDDRLDELEFDLPLAGGYRADGSPLDLHRLAEVVDGHAANSAAPLGEFAARLRARPALPVRGFLTGSIDLLARVDGSPSRYVVIDYKSNWLGSGTSPQRSLVSDYHPDRLAREMVEHDYVLQYHLYLVAVHRFLRWRSGADYDYDRDLAGVRYLFLRGMTGPQTPRTDDGTPNGVYADRPLRALVEDLDDLLRGAPS